MTAFYDVSLCYGDPSTQRKEHLTKLLETYRDKGNLNVADVDQLKHLDFSELDDVYIMVGKIFAASNKQVGIITIQGDVNRAFIDIPTHPLSDLNWAVCVPYVRRQNLEILLRLYEENGIIDDGEVFRETDFMFSSTDGVNGFAVIASKTFNEGNHIPSDYSEEKIQNDLKWAYALRNFMIICYREFCSHGELPNSLDLDKWKEAISLCKADTKKNHELL